MKEKYIAPDLYFEDFQLSQSIALGCAGDAKLVMQTIRDAYGVAYFLDSRDGMVCEVIITNLSDIPGFEGYCYWQGADGKLYLS